MKAKKEKVKEFSQLKEKVAVVWTRVSTKEQAENNNSLDVQVKECEAYAQKKNIKIVEYFGGTNESAKKEGVLFKKMITKVSMMKEVNIILVSHFDRFSRAGEEGMLTKKILKSKGVFVVSATQPTDPDSVSGEFMENILFLVSKFENNLRKDKCEAGMRESLERGDWYSKPPLGFDKFIENGKRVIKVNATGELLRKAFYWKAEGCSNVEILQRLKALGLKLYKQRLTEIFHNPFYCGKIKHAFLDGEIVKGNQEVLVSEEIFNKVNGIESNIGYTHAAETPMYPLKRHIICANCGCYMTGYEVKSKGCHYYKCNTAGCKSNQNRNKIHDSYTNLLSEYVVPKELTPIFQKVLSKVFKEKNVGQSQLHKELSKKFTECENKIKDVNLKYGLGKIPTESYETTIDSLKEEKAGIESELGKAQENLSNLEQFIDKSIQLSCNLDSLWKTSSFQIQQKLQNLLFPKGVEYFKENNNYRTKNENAVFSIFRELSAIYKNDEIKKESSKGDSLRLVAGIGLEPMTSGL